MNDSQITIQGGTSAGDGGTSLDLHLGRVLVGAPTPAAQPLTLNKTGSDGTYFEVTTNGSATSSIAGRYNAFQNGMTGSKSLSVGLATSTASAGLRSGTVAIDNLDITTQGGSGVGANDANDVVNVSFSVLDHANPSFSGSADVNAISVDFGTITVGAPAPTFGFDLFNLPTTAGFTAGLDLDAFSGAGDVSALSTNLASFSTLAAGDSRAFTASFDPSSLGSFSALYTLNFSDEDLPGAIGLGTLTLSLTGLVAATAANADFNSDGAIDGSDFLAWQRGFGGSGGLTEGDANGDGLVDSADLEIWKTQFGSPSPLTTVPEPSLAYWSIVAVLAIARRRDPRVGSVH